MLLSSLALLSLDQKYRSTLTWIHRYATLCNAPFSRMQSIPGEFMHQFWGELSTITTLMFTVLHVLLNDLVHYLIFHWVYTIFFIQQFWNFHQIRMISTLVHSFKLNFHNFVHLTTSNLETNLDDLYIKFN